jgi:hypothetical protein
MEGLYDLNDPISFLWKFCVMNWVLGCKKKCEKGNFLTIDKLFDLDDPPHLFNGFKVRC